MTIIFYPLLHC